jgi:PhnB protein
MAGINPYLTFDGVCSEAALGADIIMVQTFAAGPKDIAPEYADHIMHAMLTVNGDTLMASDGAVIMPLERQFWGATFGMVADKYGINWMFNHDETPSAD